MAVATTYSQAIKLAEIVTYEELKELFLAGHAADIIPQRQQLRGAWKQQVWDMDTCPVGLEAEFAHAPMFKYEFFNQRKGGWEWSGFTANDNVVVYFHGLGRMVTLKEQA